MEKLQPEYIESAFEEMKRTKLKALDVTGTEMIFRNGLEIQKSKAIAEGLIEGKNVAERDANTKLLFKGNFDDLEAMQTKKMVAIAMFEIARMKIDEIKVLLRVAELGKVNNYSGRNAFGEVIEKK